MSFIKFTPSLAIKAKDKPKVLNTLAKIRELFGPKGENWIKGDFEETDLETGINSFCLIGAVNKVDGKFEEAARAAIFLAVSERTKSLTIDSDEVDDPDFVQDRVIEFNDKAKTKWEDVRAILNRAKVLITKATA